MIRVLFLVTVMCVLGLAFCADAVSAPAVTPEMPVSDAITWLLNLLPPSAAKGIATAWAICTSLAIILSAVATLVRKLGGEGSRAAWLMDSIGHWLAVIGTSFRRDQTVEAAPVKPEKV